MAFRAFILFRWFLPTVDDILRLLSMVAAFSIDSQPCILFDRLGGDLHWNVLRLTNGMPFCRRSTQKIARQVARGIACAFNSHFARIC